MFQEFWWTTHTHDERHREKPSRDRQKAVNDQSAEFSKAHYRYENGLPDSRPRQIPRRKVAGRQHVLVRRINQRRKNGVALEQRIDAFTKANIAVAVIHIVCPAGIVSVC